MLDITRLNVKKKMKSKTNYESRFILKLIDGRIICIVEGSEQSFVNGDGAIGKLKEN